ncbi:MAG: CDP-diacylglycerol--glycerol-3-phosphate 3-phosphatidyltransferase, partial [Bifidobacterium sp.]
MLLLPMWSLGGGQSTPFWMTAYYFLTYAIIYVALVLCLYSGVIYLYNTFVGTKKQ